MSPSTQKKPINASTILAGRYAIEAEIGQGGMAAVYSAIDTRLGIRVALKVLKRKHLGSEEHVKRFYREAQAVARLSHMRIARLYDAGEADGAPYIAMELISGKSLEQIIGEYRSGHQLMPALEAAGRTIQALEGLAYAHAKGVIHRDIKPANIMESPEGDIKITDFGIAKALNPEAQETTLTKDFSIVGTPQYMSPEQIRGDELTGKSDVFSTGIVLYEMLTGTLPFGNSRDMESTTKMINILEKRPWSPRRINRDISPHLEDIVLRSLEKVAGRRYNAGEMLEDMRKYAEGAKIKVKGRLGRRFNASRREFLIRGGAAIVGAAAIGTAAYKRIEYEGSLSQTLDKIQASKATTIEELKPLLKELYSGLMDRFLWVYDTELVKVKKENLTDEHPQIFPFGTNKSSGRFYYYDGGSSSPGFITSLLHYACKHAAREGKSAKSEQLFKDYLYYANNIFFSGDENQITVQDKFYYPAKIALDEPHLTTNKQPAPIRNSVQNIISQYARSIKWVVEKRYNPYKKMIERIGFNDENNNRPPDSRKDSDIIEMMCYAFCRFDIAKEVLMANADIGKNIQTVEQYLNIMVNDADTKIQYFHLNDSVPEVESKAYASFLLSLIHRINLFNQMQPRQENIITNSFLAKNTQSLPNSFLNYINEKSTTYKKVLESSLNQYVQHNPGLISRFDLVKGNQSVENMATVKFMEIFGLLSAYEISTSFQEQEKQIIQRLNAPEFIAYKFSEITSDNPHGIVKMTGYDLNELGATNMETDYLYLRNLRRYIQSKT